QGGLGVRDDVDAAGEPAKPVGERLTLGRSPEPARGHHERGDAPSRPSTATPHVAQDGNELTQIAVAGNHNGRDTIRAGPHRDANPRTADVGADAHTISTG